MLDMDCLDRRILTVLKAREARDFQQILFEFGSSFNRYDPKLGGLYEWYSL